MKETQNAPIIKPTIDVIKPPVLKLILQLQKNYLMMD